MSRLDTIAETEAWRVQAWRIQTGNRRRYVEGWAGHDEAEARAWFERLRRKYADRGDTNVQLEVRRRGKHRFAGLRTAAGRHLFLWEPPLPGEGDPEAEARRDAARR